MVSLKRLLRPKKTRKWLGITSAFGLVTMAAMRIYYVREMIAALVIFSVLFLGLAVIALVIFLLDRANERVVACVESAAPRVVHWFVYLIKKSVARREERGA